MRNTIPTSGKRRGPYITKISVIDNGNDRPGVDPPLTSRGLMMLIVEKDKRATVDWQWPKVPYFFSFWGGDVIPLGNGNDEVCMSRVMDHSLVTEVAPGAEQVVWQMKVRPPNCYRSFRFPSLYPGVQWS
jgi:hypothetical protein